MFGEEIELAKAQPPWDKISCVGKEEGIELESLVSENLEKGKIV